MSASGLTIPSIFTAIDKLSPVVQKMAKGVESFANRANGAIQRVDRIINHSTSILGETQKKIFEFAKAAAIAGAIVSTIYFGWDGLIEYNKALTKFQANMRLSDAAFTPFKAQIRSVSAETYKSALEVTSAFDIIGSKMRDLKNNPEALGKITIAASELSEAFSEELAPTSASLVNVMSAFKLPAEEATKAINVLAAASASGSVKGNELVNAVASMGAAAKTHNVSLAQTAAIIQVVDKATNLGAEGAKGLEMSFVKLQKVNGAYKSGQFNLIDALQAVKSRMDKITSAKVKDNLVTEIFGRRNIIAGRALLDNIDALKQTTAAITGTDAATEMAAKNIQTFTVAWDRTKAAFINVITGSDNTTHALGGVTKALTFLYTHMHGILTVVGYVSAAFIVWKGIVLATTIIQNGLAVATAAITAAQWLFNAALFGCPLVWIIAGIAALVFIIYEAIKHWNTWGAAITIFLGPLGTAISMIQAFRNNWDNIIKAFKTEGLISGFKQIGRTIVDAILTPIQQLFNLLSKIPGMHYLRTATGIDKLRETFGTHNTDAEGNTAGNTPAINPEKEKRDAYTRQVLEKNSNQKITVDFKNLPAGAEISGDGMAKNMMPGLGSTMKFGGQDLAW